MDDRLQQRIAQLEAENSRLKRLLDADGASGGPRRRMRETVSLLRVVIQRSADRATDAANYGAHLVDRLDALARAQAAADEEGRIGLHALIADQLLRYRLGEGERISLSGPAIDLCPHAGQIFALAIHELAVNAIEHGELAGAGTLAVTWDVVRRGALHARLGRGRWLGCRVAGEVRLRDRHAHAHAGHGFRSEDAAGLAGRWSLLPCRLRLVGPDRRAPGPVTPALSGGGREASAGEMVRCVHRGTGVRGLGLPGYSPGCGAATFREVLPHVLHRWPSPIPRARRQA